MAEPLFLQPVFQERIWGGTALKDKFGYDIPSDYTGECWGISAHPNGQSIVKNGKYARQSLTDLWKKQPHLFGHHQSDVFPLLTKILDANTDLSVQVHPDDEYANVHENGELGKTECWYIVDCEQDAEIIFGHTAETKEEFIESIEKSEWNHLLKRVKIKPGDFFYIPSGTIHALGKGTIVLETQQSSDTTYRLYDYDRVDQNGNLRELHIDKSIDVTMIPHKNAKSTPETTIIQGAEITKFVELPYFTVYKWDISGKARFKFTPFLLATVLEGEAILTLNECKYPITKGEHFIIPAQAGEFELEGNAMLITSHI
ncbi:mannose-6-phosphate isomerase, class I [Bacillus sp. FJAT-50079]|uniref:mannose-6-phosphate isomerase, class I n=1 Tax=Bacillus sp. FJAT-50079 TaxID=2833577 RepID=UPI001BC8DF68|nr:mannose-6-phosphate isomerase, class I [Bacillus sp. FJAT-50079]MBS4206639.1 mannose-6-phosphate isomerase, class I [Bacillus sp. FJAT-50079]